MSGGPWGKVRVFAMGEENGQIVYVPDEVGCCSVRGPGRKPGASSYTLTRLSLSLLQCSSQVCTVDPALGFRG